MQGLLEHQHQLIVDRCSGDLAKVTAEKAAVVEENRRLKVRLDPARSPHACLVCQVVACLSAYMLFTHHDACLCMSSGRCLSAVVGCAVEVFCLLWTHVVQMLHTVFVTQLA